jgi:alpha-2-macroglobulin
VAEGSFSVMPVHAEEMYDPDVYGKGLPAQLEVEASASEKKGEGK